jgi:CRP-like cAMP-binding protein
MDIFAYFERSDFFSGVGSKSKELLAAICIPKKAAKKEVLFHEMDKGHALYLLASGAVSLIKNSPDGREIVIKVIRPGELFGEVILFERDLYPVTAIAKVPSLLFRIPKNRFYGLLSREDFRNDFISVLMKKQRYLADRIRYLTTYDVEDRFFLFIREHYGTGERVVPALSKKDTAAAIGTTPETYSRLLARLSREGKISLEGRTIRLRGDFWRQEPGSNGA